MTGYEAIGIGVSAGGLEALSAIVPILPRDYPLPVCVVQHVRDDSDDFLVRYLNERSAVDVLEAQLHQPLQPGRVYLAPPGYHLLVEEDRTFGLSMDPPVNFARPSIDVLFESAAEAYGETLVGVVLTGASSDGSRGLKRIQECGGMAVVQDPSGAEATCMPRAAIEATQTRHVLSLKEIGDLLLSFAANGSLAL